MNYSKLELLAFLEFGPKLQEIFHNAAEQI